MTFIALAGACLVMQSCAKESEEDKFDDSNLKRAIVVYAVNNSSLYSDFKNDSVEIVRAMTGVNLEDFQVLLYKTVSRDETALYKFADKAGVRTLEKVKSYAREHTSTDPAVISRVLSDALAQYPNAAYDLIFWGHGSSWVPGNSDHNVYGPQRAYGGEYNGNHSSTGVSVTDWVNLDELADAVPDHRFETIWFDCCYMGAIEVLYQFRDKCDTFVGYPTEVYSEGMAYHRVLPYLLREKPDLVSGAEAFFNFYKDQGNRPATVAVVDMSKLEDVAAAAKAICSVRNGYPKESEMVNYSRMRSCFMADMVTYYDEMAKDAERPDLSAALKDAFDTMVLYRAASPTDFNNRSWDMSKVYSLNCYYYTGTNSSNSDYYKTLDWYNRVMN